MCQDGVVCDGLRCVAVTLVCRPALQAPVQGPLTVHSFVKVVCLLNAVNFINVSFSLLARFWARTQFCSLALAVYEQVRERKTEDSEEGSRVR